MKIKQINNAKCSNRKGHILACFVAVLFCVISFAFTLPVDAFSARPNKEVLKPEPVYMPAYASEVTDKYLKADCMHMSFKGTTYEHCVTVLAAKLPKFDPEKRDHFGESYNPKKYLECRMTKAANDTSCNIYRLHRNENPEYWPYADVPAVKWPEAPSQPTYKEGMRSEEYFKALCETEAGEFIYKTVDEVEGFYEIRPRVEESDYNLSDRYVVEDPFGYVMGNAMGSSKGTLYVQPYNGKYSFWETRGIYEKGTYKGKLGNLYTSYYRELENIDPNARTALIETKKGPLGNISFIYGPYIVAKKEAQELQSKYGYTWRGISRPHDRELGITGGELIIVDLKTNKIVAVRRGFARSGYKKSKTGFWWLAPKICPQFKDKYQIDFIKSVLKPTEENLNFKFPEPEKK